jgi:hypothetical protein
MKSQKQVPQIDSVPSVDINSPLKIDDSNEVEVSTEETKGQRLFYVGLAFFCVVLLSTVAIILESNNGLSKADTIVASPSPTVLFATQPEIDKTWSIEVLNGTGVSGKAKIIADKLKLLGFESVTTGNHKGGESGNQLFLSSSVFDKKDIFINYLDSNSIDASYSGVLTNSTASARIILY